MPLHHDTVAESIAVSVEGDQLRALGGAQYRASSRVAIRVKIALDPRPVQGRDAIADERPALRRR
jgi:hypothetical protein